MIFHFLTKNKPPCLSVTKACSVFKLSRSGFFKYLQSADKPCLDQQRILQTFHLYQGLYGYRKVFHALIQQGEQVSLYQVKKTLHTYHLQSKKPKPFKPNTTQSDPNHPVAPRIFKVGETLITGLNQVWGSDITYLAHFSWWLSLPSDFYRLLLPKNSQLGIKFQLVCRIRFKSL